MVAWFMRPRSRRTGAGSGGYDARGDVAHQDYVYVFNLSNGLLAARVGPYGGTISDLAFSQDGRWLAATTSSSSSLNVIDTETWVTVMSDQTYGGDSHGVAFGPDGSLYAVAFDGKIRRYRAAPDFSKALEGATKGSTKPYSVAVDPRGKLLTIGFYESTKVDFHDAAT
jgi:WD40 repeat protein